MKCSLLKFLDIHYKIMMSGVHKQYTCTLKKYRCTGFSPDSTNFAKQWLL